MSKTTDPMVELQRATDPKFKLVENFRKFLKEANDRAMREWLNSMAELKQLIGDDE